MGESGHGWGAKNGYLTKYLVDPIIKHVLKT
jgi:hypothetical protein